MHNCQLFQVHEENFLLKQGRLSGAVEKVLLYSSKCDFFYIRVSKMIIPPHAWGSPCLWWGDFYLKLTYVVVSLLLILMSNCMIILQLMCVLQVVPKPINKYK